MSTTARDRTDSPSHHIDEGHPAHGAAFAPSSGNGSAVSAVSIPPAPRRVKRGRSVVRWLLALGVLLGGGTLAAAGVAWKFKTADVVIDFDGTLPVEKGNLLITVTEDGNVESANNVDVKCQVAGGSTILWIVKDGTQVKKGDELVRLDGSAIEEQVSSQRILYEKAQAARITAEKEFAVAKIAVQEYLEGTFIQELQTIETNIAIALENLRSAENTLHHIEKMSRKGYVTALQREAQEFAVERGKLDLANAQTAKSVLEKFTKAKMMEDLQSKRDTAEAKMRSEQAAFELEEAKLKRLSDQLENCIIVAPQDGMVVYANDMGGNRGGQQTVAVEEGAAVRERQSLIRLPDLANMQVKVTVHESKVESLRPGMRARIRVQDKTLQGTVTSVANQPEPGNWFSSNVKEYATLVRIDGTPEDLRPGMTAAVEILVANRQDIMLLPVQTVMEEAGAFYCWVDTPAGPEMRPIEVGPSSKTKIEVVSGVTVGEKVVRNPRVLAAKSRSLAGEKARSIDVEKDFGKVAAVAVAGVSPPNVPAVAGASGPVEAGGSPGARRGGAGGGFKMPTFSTVDKNGDKKITPDETSDRLAESFSTVDKNSDGGIDAAEYGEMTKQVMEMIRQRSAGAGGGPGPGGGGQVGGQ